MPVDKEYSSTLDSENFVKAGLEEEILLKEGDLLFLPRGTVHHPGTKSKISIHVSFVFNNPTYHDILKDISVFSKENRGFRHTPNYPNIQHGEIEKHLKELFTEFEQSNILNDILKIDTTKKDFENRFSDILKIHSDQLHLQSELKIRTNPRIEMLQEENVQFIRFHYYDNYIDYPLEIKEVLAFMTNNSTFIIKDIPALDDDQKISLCHELIQEGFLVFTG